jgi:hypothetical protein
MDWDETDDWLFSDAGHQWMNDRRKGKSPYINPNVRLVGGYEFGLFGFKINDCEESGQCKHGPERNFCCSVRFRTGEDYERFL